MFNNPLSDRLRVTAQILLLQKTWYTFIVNVMHGFHDTEANQGVCGQFSCAVSQEIKRTVKCHCSVREHRTQRAFS